MAQDNLSQQTSSDTQCSCTICMNAGMQGSEIDSNELRESYWLGGERVTFLATGEETNNQFSQFDLFFPTQSAAIPHTHQFSETFYVLEGELSFQVGEKTFTAKAGDVVNVPKGETHGWRNIGTTPARAIVTASPSGVENLFEAVGTPGTSTPPPVNEKILTASNSMFGTENSDSLIFNADEYSVNENGTPIAEITLLRTGSKGGEVSATINLSDDTTKFSEDYSKNQISVKFAEGETSKTVAIPLKDDEQIEANEKLSLSLSDPKGGTNIGLLHDTATLTIVDNDARPGGEKGTAIAGDAQNNTLTGNNSSDNITGGKGNDTLTGGGSRDLFTVALGDGTDTITDFGGVRAGDNSSTNVTDETDTLKFQGAGLTANNMLLTQNGSNLEITFEGVENTKVVLEDFTLEELDNLRVATGDSKDLGNILFDGQTGFQDSFDVFNVDRQSSTIDHENSVTFLNDLDNSTSGFDNSKDVINGQGGNDWLNGMSGNDLLRGDNGNDILVGGFGSDTLVGGSGNDVFSFTPREGIDTITDFTDGQDLIGLTDNLSFTDLTIIQGTGNDANNTLVTLTSSNELLTTLSGVDASTITSDDFTNTTTTTV
jgi:quercetin dioxygenase-like cupin family protein